MQGPISAPEGYPSESAPSTPQPKYPFNAYLLAGPLYMGTDDYTEDQLISRVQELADLGHPYAHCELAHCYESGSGFVQNPEMALHHLKAAADRDDFSAFMALGLVYETGHYMGMPDFEVPIAAVDRAEAKKWYLRAFDLKPYAVCQSIVNLILDDRPFKDCSEAEREEIIGLCKASKQFYVLGKLFCNIYDPKDATAEDVAQAVKWYEEGERHKCGDCELALETWAKSNVASEKNDTDSLACSHVRSATSNASEKKEGWSAMQMLLTPLALVLWAIIGTSLLALFTAISSVTFPLLIGGSFIYAIYKGMKR